MASLLYDRVAGWDTVRLVYYMTGLLVGYIQGVGRKRNFAALS